MKTWCPECKMHEAADADEPKYCSDCGHGLVEPPPKQVCSHCLQLVRAGAKYCRYCGVGLSTNEPVIVNMEAGK